MFRFRIYGCQAGHSKAVLIACTDFADVANFIADNAVKALDPTGEKEFSVTLVETKNTFIKKEDL